PSVLRRFALEAQVLGRLQHPGIAQIHEAGTFDLGDGSQPYFAMELVDGRALIEHADRAGLGTEGRIRMLVDICDAVHHAHQKGVIHRDLKPANILVDPAGQPKILDFGVARSTDADLVAVTLQTARGELVGTISYMSPEQLADDPDALDTRSDLYALGVIAYELLTGRLPYETTAGTIVEISRAIETDDPVPLGSVDRRFRGDLETILTKALEKEKSRRYESAAAMASDFARYLAHEPIAARPPTRLYQLRKFARRNRVLVGGVAATFVALVAGLVLTTWQAHRASEAAALALRESAQANAVTEFLRKIFEEMDPHTAGRKVDVRALVDRAAGDIDTVLADKPLGRAAVHNEVGTIYFNLGVPDVAGTHFEAALAIWEQQHTEDHGDVLKAVNNLGLVHMREGRNDEAEVLFRRALEGRQRVHGADDHHTLATMNNLAMSVMYQGDVEEGERLLRETLARQTAALGPGASDTVTSATNLGSLLRDRGDLEEAEGLHRNAVERARAELGDDEITTLMAISSYGRTLRKLERYDEAKAMYVEATEGLGEQLGKNHPTTLIAAMNCASLCETREEWEEGARRFADAAAGYEAEFGDAAPNLYLALDGEARCAMELDDCARAAAALRRVVAEYRRSRRPGSNRTVSTESRLARCLVELERFEEAEAVLLASYESVLGRRGPDHERTHDVITRLVRVYERWGRQAEATQWRKRLPGDG
ncbi:MAG: tetratricopeptide repeat protein, partial [Planctomycetota bacterium]